MRAYNFENGGWRDWLCLHGLHWVHGWKEFWSYNPHGLKVGKQCRWCGRTKYRNL